MDKILGLLIENSEIGITKTFKVSERLPEITIRPISNKELGELRTRAVTIDKNGKNPIVDVSKFQSQAVALCTLNPNFNDAEAVKKAKVMSGSELVNKILLAGEIELIYNEINKISGFGLEINEEIEDTKKL